MRSFFKKLYITLLELKAKKVLNSHSKLIFVIGDIERSLYSQQIVEFLTNLPYHIERTPLGYNHRLGVALTILGMKAGKSSLKYWLKVLYTPARTIAVKTLLLLDIALVHQSEIDHFMNLYHPDYVVTTPNVMFDIKDIPSYTSKNSIVYCNGEVIAEIVSSTDTPSHVVTYKTPRESKSLSLNNFGVQYEIPAIIGVNIKNKLS